MILGGYFQMKRWIRWICAALFVTAAAFIIWFLHLFTQVNVSMQYIDWTDSVQVMPDGTEQPFEWDSYSNTSEITGIYRFYGSLPSDLPSGSLLFETNGAVISLTLDGEPIYQSNVAQTYEAVSMAQATLPLPEGTFGEVVMTCEITDASHTMFPPLLRFIPENLDIKESTALANRTAFPTGAAALALILIFGLFLLGVSLKKADFSLIPLLFALVGLVSFQLIQDEGYYFLPQSVSDLFSHRGINFSVIILLVLYLAMNRRRQFWKHLCIAAAWSAAALLIGYIISLSGDGYLAFYIREGLIPELQAGIYSGLLYWLTLWLSVTSALISAYGMARAFIDQGVQAQSLRIKNHLMTEGYQALEQRITEDASARHELNHQLTALQCLLEKKDYQGLGQMLSHMAGEQSSLAQTSFTGNHTLNTILQDAAGKAKRNNIRFQAQASVPDELNIPDTDLCGLFMNILDNALEAAEKVETTDRRYIKLQVKSADLYLTVKCINSFNGVIKKDKKGNLMTTKEDSLSHGLGLKQIAEIAEKYHSTLIYHYTDDGVYTLQTALRIPD
ncbi:hypothetical protein B5G27_10575 [Lachnoclostridium sp. An76]|nr:hypothetical protein B5G27_10575 [Lachnoclostridium sp. An76]